jgi:hypothetical protein
MLSQRTTFASAVMFVPRARARSVLKKNPKLGGAPGITKPQLLPVSGGGNAEQNAKLMMS